MKKKKILSIIMVGAMALSLAACGTKTGDTNNASTGNNSSAKEELELPSSPDEPTEDQFVFTRENFPKIDGSTSLVPLGQGIASVLLGETREDASDVIEFHKTTQSFRNLTAGECDIVIAAEPKSDVFDEMEENAFEYEIETIAKEALVFVVNEDNPVDSLTQQQLVDIYSGKITNWKEVGGNDAEIEAFQRNPGAGSQVMMEKLVMGDTPMAEAPEAMVASEMGELLESVKAYDNSANAIGYTVYYYATDMQMANGLKIIKVNDILPGAETIRSETYPFINGYYACIDHKLEDDDPARILYNWLVSDAGQQLLTLEGYVSVTESGAKETGSNVFATYKNYTPFGNSAAKYERIAEGKVTDLAAVSDVDYIHPYTGEYLYYKEDDNLGWVAGSLQGFYDSKGRLLTDPVYTRIYDMSTYFGNYPSIWSFEKTEGETSTRGMAAGDGSWVTECKYTYLEAFESCIVGYKNENRTEFDVYDFNGKIIKTEADLPDTLEDGYIYNCSSNGYYSYITLFDEEAYENGDYEPTKSYLLDKDMKVVAGPFSYIQEFHDGYAIVEDIDTSMYSFIDTKGNTVSLDTKYESMYYLGNGYWEADYYDGDSFRATLLDKNLKVASDEVESIYSYPSSNYIEMINNGEKTFFKGDLSPLFDGRSFPSSYEYTGIGNLFYHNDDGTSYLTDVEKDKTMTFMEDQRTYGYAYSISDNYCVINVYAENYDSNSSDEYYLVDKEMNIEKLSCNNVYSSEDPVTDKKYILMSDAYGFNGETRVLDADTRAELFKKNGSISIYADTYIVVNEWATTCYNSDGEVIFCYPFFGGSSSGD